MTTDRVLRLPQVMAATGMSKVSVYRRVADGSFPKQIKLAACPRNNVLYELYRLR